MDDLWAAERQQRRQAVAPLAARMRPATLDDVVGQPHLLAPGSAFRTMVDSGRLLSMILWGPPGSGKTTLARLVADDVGAHFAQLSATSAGVKDVRGVLADASQRLGEHGARTVLFLDEIHRFTKSQQDALLPGVEDGTIVLIGATTENPFFEVNSPLLSRATLFKLEPLQPGDVRLILERALASPVGLAGRVEVKEDAIEALAERSGGDARSALNALEVAATLAGEGVIDVSHVEEALQRRLIRYDRKGDQHYDVISAFIKSMRGSDPDAAVYWLHTMLEAGEDPEFIARRIIIAASEDVGMADPSALGVAVSAFDALRVVGLPEAGFAMTQAAIHIAMAPKSNAVKRAMLDGKALVQETAHARVPLHLQSAGTAGERAMGEGVDYRNPHDAPDRLVPQQYFPDGVDAALYRPTGQGSEAAVAERLRQIDERLQRRRRR